MLDNIELADRFIQMAEKFIGIFKERQTKLNFDKSKVEINACGTIACHGGFGLLALSPRKVRTEDFNDGARKLALFLGFEDDDDLENWALANPDIWGGEDGHWMFCPGGYRAFGRTEEDPPMTLGDIASWYLDVAGRLLGQK